MNARNTNNTLVLCMGALHFPKITKSVTVCTREHPAATLKIQNQVWLPVMGRKGGFGSRFVAFLLSSEFSPGDVDDSPSSLEFQVLSLAKRFCSTGIPG